MTNKTRKTAGIVVGSIGLPTLIVVATWLLGAGEFVGKVPATEERSKKNSESITVVQLDIARIETRQEERHQAVMKGFDRIYKAIDK